MAGTRGGPHHPRGSRGVGRTQQRPRRTPNYQHHVPASPSCLLPSLPRRQRPHRPPGDRASATPLSSTRRPEGHQHPVRNRPGDASARSLNRPPQRAAPPALDARPELRRPASPDGPGNPLGGYRGDARNDTGDKKTPLGGLTETSPRRVLLGLPPSSSPVRSRHEAGEGPQARHRHHTDTADRRKTKTSKKKKTSAWQRPGRL